MSLFADPIAIMHCLVHRLQDSDSEIVEITGCLTEQCCDPAAVFFFIAAFLVWCDKKFAGANYNNEQFNVSKKHLHSILSAIALLASGHYITCLS